MTTLGQAAADLIAAPRPVLFVDTCTLLDIVRAPLRDLTLAVRAGVELRALAAAGTVRLFVQDIVPGEWADNLPAARRDGEAGVRAFTATWQIAADLGRPAPRLPVLPPGTLIDELERLSHDLLMAANQLERDHAVLGDRSSGSQAEAVVGKGDGERLPHPRAHPPPQQAAGGGRIS